MKKIVFIGDSHASFFSGKDVMQPIYPEKSANAFSDFSGIRLGPVLAYSLNKANSQFKGREKLFECLEELNPNEHIVGLCFGEIDCRCHIVKQAERQSLTIEQAVANCFEHYNAVIDEIRALGFQVVLWNVIPTSPSTINNPEFPHYGTDAERVRATEAFNIALVNKADNKNIFSLSIYKKLYDGRRKDVHFFDGVHLSQSAMFYAIVELNRIFKMFSTGKLLSAGFRSSKVMFVHKYLSYKKALYKAVKSNTVEVAV